MSNNPRIKQMSIHRPIVYGNTATILDPPVGSHTHKWTIAVRSASGPPPNHYTKRGGGDVQQVGGSDPLPWIKKVTFRLHETYANPVRTVDKPPFEITETGWGEFDVQIKIFFVPEASEKPISFYHRLKLHPWPAEIVDPPNNLVAGPPPSQQQEQKEQQQNQNQASQDQNSTSNGTQSSSVQNGNNDQSSNNATTASENGTKIEQPAQATTEPADASNKQNEAPDSNDNPNSNSENDNAPVDTNNDNNAAEASVEQSTTPVITSPVHSWQYDEMVFHEPTESFYNLLIKHPPTPLPKTPRQPIPKPNLPIGQGGVIGELSQQTERQEAERLENATSKALYELEQWRSKLIANEAEIGALRKELDESTK